MTRLTPGSFFVRGFPLAPKSLGRTGLSTHDLSVPYLPAHSRYAGVRRESVTQAASNLQKLGVVSYSRELIKVLDRPHLSPLSCECYAVVKKETDLLLDYIPQRQVITNTDAIPTAAL